MDFEELATMIIVQGCDDIREMARHFTQIINMVDMPTENTHIFLSLQLRINKNKPLEDFKKLYYSHIGKELKSILYCVDISAYICNDCSYIWKKFVKEIQQDFPFFYSYYIEDFDNIIERAVSYNETVK